MKKRSFSRLIFSMTLCVLLFSYVNASARVKYTDFSTQYKALFSKLSTNGYEDPKIAFKPLFAMQEGDAGEFMEQLTSTVGSYQGDLQKTYAYVRTFVETLFPPKHHSNKKLINGALIFGALVKVTDQTIYFFSSNQPDAKIVMVTNSQESVVPIIKNVSSEHLQLKSTAQHRYVYTQYGWSYIEPEAKDHEIKDLAVYGAEYNAKIRESINDLTKELDKLAGNKNQELNKWSRAYLPIQLLALSLRHQTSDKSPEELIQHINDSIVDIRKKTVDDPNKYSITQFKVYRSVFSGKASTFENSVESWMFFTALANHTQKTVLLFEDASDQAVKIAPNHPIPEVIVVAKPAFIKVPSHELWFAYSGDSWVHVPPYAQNIEDAIEQARNEATVINIFRSNGFEDIEHIFTKTKDDKFRANIDVRKYFVDGSDINLVMTSGISDTYKKLLGGKTLEESDFVPYIARNLSVFKKISKEYLRTSLSKILLFSIIATHTNKTVYLQTITGNYIQIVPVLNALPEVSYVSRMKVDVQRTFASSLYFIQHSGALGYIDWKLVKDPSEIPTPKNIQDLLPEAFDPQTVFQANELYDAEVEKNLYRIYQFKHWNKKEGWSCLDSFVLFDVPDESKDGVDKVYTEFEKKLQPNDTKSLSEKRQLYLAFIRDKLEAARDYLEKGSNKCYE